MNPTPPALAALIVDDDPSVCGVFSRLLMKMGYSVQTVERGEPALELVKAKTFDLCLVDKQLPGVGGVSVARAIRSHTPDAVIIFITGHATTSSADELVGIADEYLSKPFDLDTLRETVGTLVARRKGQRQTMPSPAPVRQEGQKWVHLYCDDAATNALMLTACTQLGVQVTQGVQLPAEPPDVLVMAAAHASFDVRKAIWGFQAKRRGFHVVLLTDPRSASDSAAAVALKASWRISLPPKPEQAFVVLSGALK